VRSGARAREGMSGYIIPAASRGNMKASIVSNPDVLDEGFVPDTLLFRDAQMKELAACIHSSGRKTQDCLCHGSPGTGKTSLVRYVLSEASNYAMTKTFYINCWERKTLNAVLDELVMQAGLVVPESGSTQKTDRLRHKLGDQSFVIALDEVDKLESKELNDILYILKGLGAGLICVSNSRRFLICLDPRVTSRIGLSEIHFRNYTDEEIVAILRNRVEYYSALNPQCCGPQLLTRIAELSEGDARVAIQTLGKAADIAESAGRKQIEESDLLYSFADVRQLKQKYQLETLSPHHKAIVKLLQTHKEISSSQFYGLYRRKAGSSGIKAKSARSFNNYLKDLLDLKLIDCERSNVRGNVRIFTAHG